MGEKLPYEAKRYRFLTAMSSSSASTPKIPTHNFAPSPGRLEYYIPPGGPHVRVDSACYSGYRIPPNYDSMIAKLIVRGKDREEAIAIGKRALREFHIGGVHSTIPFHLFMLDDEKFLNADFTLSYIDGLIAEGCQFTND